MEKSRDVGSIPIHCPHPLSPSIVTSGDPYRCPKSCGGTWVRSGRRGAQLEGSESQIPVCGAVIRWRIEPEWLGLSIPGAQDRLGGGSGPPRSRGIQRRVLNSLHVPGLRSPSSCTRHPEGQPARIIPAAIPVKNFPEAEFLLLLGHSSQAGKIPGAYWDPAPSAKPEGTSLSIPRLCCPWDGIPGFHPEGSSRTSLWRAAGG